jgi:hypothetical protein
VLRTSLALEGGECQITKVTAARGRGKPTAGATPAEPGTTTVTFEPSLTVFAFVLQLWALGDSTGAVIGATTCATIGSSETSRPPEFCRCAVAATPPSPPSPESSAPRCW